MKELSKKELEKLLLKTELEDPNKIKLNPDNPRTITKTQFRSLVKSVTEFYKMLFLRPIILDDEGFALGGNMRTLAAREAGFKLVPIIRATNLTILERREFVIKDNLSFGEWNYETLANNWDSALLADWGFEPPDKKEIAVSFNAKPKEPVFDIVFQCETELERQDMLRRIEKAGFMIDSDYILA